LGTSVTSRATVAPSDFAFAVAGSFSIIIDPTDAHLGLWQPKKA
jgi:hypothetical protein